MRVTRFHLETIRTLLHGYHNNTDTHWPATKENVFRSMLVPKPSELHRNLRFEQMLFGVGMYAYTKQQQHTLSTARGRDEHCALTGLKWVG